MDVDAKTSREPSISMEDIIIPPTFCPFSLQVNPHLETLQHHSLEWATHFYRSYQQEDDSLFLYFIKGNYYKFVAYTYPTADLNMLVLAHDWIAWGFILDDFFDYGPLRTKPEAVREYIAHLLSILSYPDLSDHAPPAQDPLAVQLDQWWRNLLPYTTLVWRKRFFQHTADWLRAYYWEAQNRAQKIIPDEKTYREKRLDTGGSHTNFDLMELAEHIELPSQVYDHPVYQNLLRAANQAIIWGNDLFSLSKEQAHGELHSFALIVQHEHQCSLQEAVTYLSDLISAEVRRFLALEQQILALFPEHVQLLQRLLASIKAWIAGSRKWHSESRRYRDVEEITPNLAVSSSEDR